MTARYLTYDAADALNWQGAVEALRQGHFLPRAEIGDLFLGPAEGTLLTRGAYLEGLGYGVKSVTVMPGNPARDRPSVQGAMIVFDPDTGAVRAVIDSTLVTEFKTAGDSVLAAVLLARPESRRLLILGAGTVARSLCAAYPALFPDLERIDVWARRKEQAEALAAELAREGLDVRAAGDLPAAVAEADIVATATMAQEPVLKGDWIRPGTHVDLIGAFRADMREADDALISGGRLFVDSRETTLGHIGELKIPLAAGVISEADVLGDLYDLVPDPARGRRSENEVTVFKNGGGAHLDLMVADYIARTVD
ncbi:ornithine cyclodeaminase family protein [Roseivivax sediminis]|uniref:Ornithine cyclodeaminase n=1 Tax=Roseivivax sediminis TaxID=936889 RepID=A0A1I2DBP4_9RHOB|nr:ornithine cyclodeaminase [Roseivivax sediminis]SFE77878.1 ornithine cyclodeaminase [Roseivivax sediminis]